MTQVKAILLKAKREKLFSIMQDIYDVSNKFNVDKTLKGTLLAKASSLDILLSDFKAVIDECEAIEIENNPDYKPTFQGFDSFLEMYGSVKLAIQKLSSTPAKASSTIDVPKLPALDLPSFSGNPRDWPTFYETFKSVIHENKSLTNDQKVQYLISRLKDQALSLCSGIPPIGSNYETLFKALTDRYQDVRSLASFYIDNILNFKPIKEESKVEYNNFIDQFGASVAALKALKIPNLDEFILYAIGIKKLDVELCKKFESKCLDDEGLPVYRDLIKFVQDYVRVIERTDRAPVSKSVTPKKFPPKLVSMVAASSSKEDSSCQVCKKKHPMFQCGDFEKMQPSQRLELVKSLKLCFNCFSSKHSVKHCSNKHSCKICKFKHHTLLHLSSYVSQEHKDRSPPTSDVPETKDSVVACCSASSSSSQANFHTVLLATVKAHVRNTNGENIQVRMLLDSGSMCSMITKACCSQLGLKYQPVALSVSGVGSSVSQAKGITSFQFSSRFDDDKRFVVPDALVVDKITKLPTCPVNVHALKHLSGLQLSDDTYHTPGNIDCLIGAELFSQIVGQRRTMPDDSPVILKSALGDIIMGRVPALSSGVPLSLHVSHVTPEETLDTIMQKFWSMEEVPSTAQALTLEEEQCDKYFTDTTQRLSSGRYAISLPFKVSPTNLGNSYEVSKKRLFSLERKFQTNPDLKSNYSKAIQAYFDDGHASLVADFNPHAEGYIMPHHAVVRPDKSTTKTRIVFDNSCATSTGISLNDVLHTGPMLYKSLFDLLINFRLFPFACTGDIRKMFLQVVIQEADRKYQRFLWRDSTDKPVQCFEMERLVFGAKPSPFIAQRVLLQLASDEEYRYPKAARELSSHFYMDDYLTSYLDREEAVSTITQLVSLLQDGGFELTKLASNDGEILDRVSAAQHVVECVQWDTESYMKVLGIQWNPTDDCFAFKVNLEDIVCTKRGILSTVAKIFDILGLISPVITFAKLIIKELWCLNLDWDQTPPNTVCQKWIKFVQELPQLQDFKISRHLSIVENSTVSLIGFCDSSSAAMGACVYVHVNTGGVISTHLICAKSKIAPVKYVTIPRLELCSALLLAKLMDSVLKVFKSRCEVNQVLCFGDSTVALYWISSQPSRWKTFVANRVTKIQELVSEEKWFHVKGIENPADCLSRGITPKELISHKLWSCGPPWLSSPVETWVLRPVNETVLDEQMSNDKLLEEKLKVLHTSEPKVPENILLKLSLRISKWNILLRAVALVLKFCRLLPPGTISVQDLHTAEIKIIQALQGEAFRDDINNLKNNKPISHTLLKLRPYLKDNTLLCGGRISNANQIDYQQAHPIILPKKHHIVDLLIDYEHQKNLHTGPQLLLSILRRKYWILGGRDVVRQRIMKCVVCFKNNPKTITPRMGDLPPCRVQESKAFQHCGVDYAGPFNVTISRHRGVRSQKAYLCLFVCMSTKALHLELASSLTTEAFLSCLRRFIARRGAVKMLYCDQGTNFVGASNTLNDMYKFLDSSQFKDAFQNELLDNRIEFQFNPPSSPHFGGLWESNVRQVKTHLYKVIGSQILTYEELNTVLIEIEAILNSRPLCPIDSDASAPQALTPAHFLMQQPIQCLPCSGDPALPAGLSQRFKLVGQMVQSFWKRFSHEYLSQLQERAKWLKDDVQLKPGLLVLIKDDNAPVLSWPLGRILEVYPGHDGVVRVARVQISGGELRRPAVKLCPLPNQG